MLARLPQWIFGSGAKRPARRLRSAYISHRLGLETLEKRDLPSVSFVPNELLIRYTPGATAAAKATVRNRLAAVLEERLGAAPARSGTGDAELVRVPAGLAVTDLARSNSSSCVGTTHRTSPRSRGARRLLQSQHFAASQEANRLL